MERVLILALLTALLLIWLLSARGKLAVLDENARNAMNQIGVQLSSRFDALGALLDSAKGCAAQEAQTQKAGIEARRSKITANSTPDDVRRQEDLIREALGRIATLAEQYPDWKADQNYAACRNAVNSYEKMLDTSRLIYNDSVAKLNRTVCSFPTNLIAGLLGFSSLGYLAAAAENETALNLQ